MNLKQGQLLLQHRLIIGQPDLIHLLLCGQSEQPDLKRPEQKSCHSYSDKDIDQCVHFIDKEIITETLCRADSRGEHILESEVGASGACHRLHIVEHCGAVRTGNIKHCVEVSDDKGTRVGRVLRTVHEGREVVGDLSVDEGIGDVTEDKHGYWEACSVKEGSQYAQHHEEGIQTSGIAELAGGGGGGGTKGT